MKKILVVDDEEDLCEILRFNLKNAGYQADVAYSAEEAFVKLRNKYDLLLLDVMMSGISGFKFAELIRSDYNNDVPIIFITARDTENDKLSGFRLGADDYITKPFSVKEVLARVSAVLYRNNERVQKEIENYKKEHSEEKQNLHVKESAGQIINIERLIINNLTKSAFIGKENIKLTKKEFEILYALASKPNKVLTRTEIFDLVWKKEAYVLERTVDVHIARLRKKLDIYGKYLTNKFGYGYCFEQDEIQ
jgi:two-component system alkaline phosphatase synthesis response regulator PhoP